MRSCWVLGLLVVLFLPGELFAQAPPPPPPPPPPMAQPRDVAQKTGTARLAGRVTSLDTGRPLRRAVVRAAGAELQEGKSVSTDAEGKWELRDLPAGRYNISVTKGGYVSLSYGQSRPFESGKAVEVANGQLVDKLDVSLPRGSAVTGRVVDEFGEPVTNVRVTPMRYRSVGGQRRLVVWGAGDTTDDLGQYRLHGLPPGEYYVSAQSTAFTFLGSSEDKTGYGQTFYPGALNAGEATRVSLAVGQEAQNIVIALTPTRIATVSGTATTSNGKPIPMGVMMLRSAAAGDFSGMRSGFVRDGSWTMTGVVPGEYYLTLQYVPNLEQMAASGGPVSFQAREAVVEKISVTGDDIKGLALVTSPGGSAKGKVRFEGGPPPPSLRNLSVQSFDATGSDSMMLLSSGGPAQADGSFEVRSLVGTRVFRPMGLPPGWTLKAVMYDGTDVTDTGLDFAAGQEISGLEIIVTQKGASVSGTVQNQSGAAISDYVVILFSPDRERWGPQSRFIRSGRPDQTGRFLFRDLAPASYLAVALEYVEPGEETNPEFLERVKDSGTPVRVAEGENKGITLKLIAQ